MSYYKLNNAYYDNYLIFKENYEKYENYEKMKNYKNEHLQKLVIFEGFRQNGYYH